MPHKKTIDVYYIDELSDDAKRKAIQDLRDTNRYDLYYRGDNIVMELLNHDEFLEDGSILPRD